MRHERQVIPPKPPEPEVVHHITLTEQEARSLMGQLAAYTFPLSTPLLELQVLLGKRNQGGS